MAIDQTVHSTSYTISHSQNELAKQELEARSLSELNSNWNLLKYFGHIKVRHISIS